MMPRNAPWQSYRKIAAQTASSGQLVLMLYDGAINFAEKALAGFAYKDPLQFNQTINNNLIRSQSIIHELNARLDMDRGGEIAANFRRLYSYFYRRLQEGNLKKKAEPIEEVIGHLRVLRDSWSQMLKGGGGGSDAEAKAALQAA